VSDGRRRVARLTVAALAAAIVAVTPQQASAAPTPDSTEWYAWSSNNDRGTNLQLVTCAAQIQKFSWTTSREVTFDVTFGCKGDDSLIDNAVVVTHIHQEYTANGRTYEGDVKSQKVARLVDFDRYRSNGWTYLRVRHTASFRPCNPDYDTHRIWAEMAYRISLYDSRNGDRHVIETPADKSKRPISQALRADTDGFGRCQRP
jgi:hypothetical protein